MARLLTFFIALVALTQSPTYKIGDRVEAHDIGWYKGAVTIIGTGTNQGQYFVKYDDFSTGRYFSPSNLRPGAPPAAPKSYPAYNLGDHVEGYDFGWHPATVTEIRAGKNAPEYLIKYEKFASSRWYHPKDMRSAAAAAIAKAPVPASTTGPRPGKYNIYSYGAVANNPLYLGHLEILAGGQYRASRTSSGPYYGEGTYRFNAAASAVEWLTGPYATPDWDGKFSEEAGRHRIALRARTIATNSP